MSPLKRFGSAALVVACMLLAAVSFSQAATAYPTGTNPAIGLNQSAGAVGTSVVVSGAHFTPGKTASLSFHSATIALNSVTVSPTGTFTTTITVPNVNLGNHEVDALDVASGQVATAAFDVNGNGTLGAGGGSSGGSGGGLANTGVAVLGIAAVGVVLLVGGGLMLMAGRRRKVMT